MKIYFVTTVITLLSMASCKHQTGWIIENPLPVQREDEVIVLTRNDVAEKLAIPGDKVPVFRSDGMLLPSQIDDMDGDGKWDEAAVLIGMEPSTVRKIVVSFVEQAAYPQFEKRTGVRLGIVQPDGSFREVNQYSAPSCKDSFLIIAQAESVNWENEKFGFRNYFDCRNVKDLFGKLKPVMVIDSLAQPGTQSYHELADWGMDVLHCGSSLGSGGLALLLNDSLYRLGSTDVYEYRKVTEGPVRSVFELIYKGWQVDSFTLEAVERISIFPGKYWFRSEVTIANLPVGAEIVTGIVTSRLKKEPFEFREYGFTCMGTHDTQSLNNDELGMAVIVPENQTGRTGRTTDIDFFKLGFQTVKEKNFSQIISETCYISQKATARVPSVHWFAAVWGAEREQWKTEEGFRNYLRKEMEKLAFPLVIKKLSSGGKE